MRTEGAAPRRTPESAPTEGGGALRRQVGGLSRDRRTLPWCTSPAAWPSAVRVYVGRTSGSLKSNESLHSSSSSLSSDM